ncbi:MAG: M56 family metallopeptidase [Gemmatimonadaceae bacterium]
MMSSVTERLASATLSWVVYGSIKATAVLALAYAFTRWRGLSAATRHAVWCSAIVGALLMPAVRVALPAWNVAVYPAASERIERSLADASSRPVVVATVADRAARAAVDITPPATVPVVSVDASEVTWPVDRPVADATVPSQPIQSNWTANEGLAVVWALGALAVLFPWVIGSLRLRRLWTKSAPSAVGTWSEAWRLAASASRRRLDLRVSELTAVPMTWGLWRPRVLVPVADDWSLHEQRAALLHELAHVRRLDALWQTVSRLVKSIFWFNPLVWLADAALRAEAERACDDAVLRSGTRPSEYAQQLLDVLNTTGGRRPPVAAALSMARRSGMAARLRAVLDANANRRALSRWSRTSIVTAMGLVGVPLARLTPVAAPGRATRDESKASEGTAAAPRLGPQVTAPSAMETAAVARTDGTGQREGALTAESPSEVQLLDRPMVWSLTPSSGPTPTTSEGQWRVPFPATAERSSPSLVQGDCLTERGSSSSWISNQSRNGKTSMHVKWSSGSCRVTFDLDGEVTLNADATDVVALSRGGSLDLSVEDGASSHRLTLDEKGGTLERKYWVNDERKPWDAAAAAWFAQALVALDHRTAFAVDQRLPALLKEGGVDRVLTEVERMGSEYAARVYYTKLFKLQPLSVAQVQRVLAHVASQVDSDYERAELLLEVAKLNTFGPEAHVAFAGAAAGIKSDYEKRRALTALLTRRGLSMPAVKALLGASQGMQSDYELAELLVEVSSQYAISDDTRPLYLAALGTLESDYEHRRVLDAIVAGGGLTSSATRDILTDASRMKSDYELAEFLTKVAASGTLDASNVDAFFSAVSAVQGDYECHRVLTSLLKRDKLGKEMLLRVIDASRQLKSDYERASLLVEVASAGSVDESMRPAYERAAGGIKSEYEYGRAMAAIRRNRS